MSDHARIAPATTAHFSFRRAKSDGAVHRNVMDCVAIENPRAHRRSEVKNRLEHIIMASHVLETNYEYIAVCNYSGRKHETPEVKA